jgi:phosphoribosyl-ATP pyrophosphohydrolase
MADPLARLYATIAARKGADPASSYTAKLFAKGRHAIAQKVGEEGLETALAAVGQDRSAVAAESADLLYHLCVLWAEVGLTPDDIAAVLAAREGTSGLAEKAARTND